MSVVQRHKAAIRRSTLSKPLKLALEAGILAPGGRLFDYGCGYADDVRLLQARKIKASGWDPHHRPNAVKMAAPVVNLGFVLNVIERPRERFDVLTDAWSLTEDTLLVAALVLADARGSAVPFGDGVMTSIGTFQKYYDQQELETLVATATGVVPIPLAMGVFAAVRDSAKRAQLLTRKYRYGRRVSHVAAVELFEGNQDAVSPIIDFFMQHGRWPSKSDSVDDVAAFARLGGRGRAVAIAKRVVSPEAQRTAVARARSDLLVLLGLCQLTGGSRLRDFDEVTQRDVRAHFKSLQNAATTAKELLFSLGESAVVRLAVRASTVGKKMPDAIYVHTSAVDQLPTHLRMYEACARRFVGGTEGSNIVKLRINEPMVSYLSYPAFEKAPHPALHRSLTVDLRSFRIALRDYSTRESPPILHRKEAFVDIDHPMRAKFERLTAQEERWDLYDGSTGDIGTLGGWQRRLEAAGVHLRGHRICQGSA